MFWNLKIGVKFYLFNPSDNFFGRKKQLFLFGALKNGGIKSCKVSINGVKTYSSRLINCLFVFTKKNPVRTEFLVD